SAILFNCCQPEVIGDALDAAREAIAKLDSGQQILIGAYANAFGAQSHAATANAGLSAIRQDLGPSEYLAWAERWLAQGAHIVGGCCGVGPEHIALLDDLVRSTART